MEFSLSGLPWQVKGYWPYVPLKEKSMETGQTLQGVTDWLPATVPGGIHQDLFRAGLIGDPYFGQNSLACEWVENRWWMYRTEFGPVLEGQDLRREAAELVFLGLDYEAEVFFNGVSCGSHTGMYDAFRVELTGRVQDKNELLVLFKGIPQEMGQIGYTSRTSTQKSRFNYKWDFSTRLVNIGFWQDVVIRLLPPAELSDLSVSGTLQKGEGELLVSARLTDRRTRSGPLRLCLWAEGPFDRRSQIIKELDGGKTEPKPAVRHFETELSLTERSLTDGKVSARLSVPEPALWQPRGSGRPFLYEVHLELFSGERRLWEKTLQTGIRSLSLTQNEAAPADALPYTFVVNGRKTYIRGMNLTPLDHLYGCVGRERYEALTAALAAANVNLARVWGGGLIEKEEFYDLCDENGILVWQEFIQSSSGIDNKPCEEEAFLALLERAATACVRQKRNHVSLAVYSGGNELMEAPDRPCGLDNKNLALLRQIVKREDQGRFFLPTSASGPREFVTRKKGVSHDVHGNWRYEGNPGHYELYGGSDSLFHSEFGMDGTACTKSLRKFLPEHSLHPTPMSGNADWRHHGEWWGTYFRDCEMFGPIRKSPEELERFVRCSQYLQGEGLRFILEADRRRAFCNSGTIIWQLNEPWPNSSCTNLVDYYGETKPAYYQAKRAYEPRHVSADYRSLTFLAGSMAALPVYVSNSLDAFDARVQAGVYALDGRLLWETALEKRASENRSTKLGTLSFPVPAEEVFLLRLTLLCGEERASENTYLFSTREREPFSALRQKDGAAAFTLHRLERQKDGLYRAELSVENIGGRAVLDAGVFCTSDGYGMLGTDNYTVLLPGEKRTFTFVLWETVPGPFEKRKARREPEFALSWL
ncbi:MAG: glycoside hydrolase family 2 TIM barrel-domain containing protein [Eubacteriales bacterium]|nr:glycoside hydrolase family 2 TIM barrel-domain containing protein [Eubacteriales bacterium]